MQPPALYTARLEDKVTLTPRFIQYMFELKNPLQMPFEAGQYVSIKVADRGDRRSYSICSSPNIQHGFELMVDLKPNGVGVQYLEGLQFGAEISLLGPLGRFVVTPTQTETALYFIATGSGIAPFRSMILDLLEKQDKRPIVLYWGLRQEQDMFWQLEFQELSKNYPHFSFQIILSQPQPEWPLNKGRVTDLVAALEKPVTAGYYLCGNGKMVTDVTAQLAAAGVDPTHIHSELFY
jgi:ferredoxin-NADP reductase